MQAFRSGGLRAFLAMLLMPAGMCAAQEWRFYGGDAGGTRNSPLKQINPLNVHRLQRAWTYHMGEIDRIENAHYSHNIAPFEATPLMIDGVL